MLPAHPLRVTARPLRGIVSCSRSLCLMHLFVLVSCPLPIETTLFICHFNCPIFNVFCCVGHCIISLRCPLSMTSRTCFCSHDSRYIDSILHKPSGSSIHPVVVTHDEKQIQQRNKTNPRAQVRFALYEASTRLIVRLSRSPITLTKPSASIALMTSLNSLAST
jgi:hypothetical protein